MTFYDVVAIVDGKKKLIHSLPTAGLLMQFAETFRLTPAQVEIHVSSPSYQTIH